MTSLPDQRAREVADLIDEYDQQIKDLQDGKRETFISVRAELENMGLSRPNVAAEIAALKSAIAARRKRREATPEQEEREHLTEEYLTIIEARAPRATRVATSVPAPVNARAERAKARFSESMSDHAEFSAELTEAGLISPEAHAENVALAKGLAEKFGAGPSAAAPVPDAPKREEIDITIPAFLDRRKPNPIIDESVP
jgi:dGTP triphosphohydrolase